MISGCEEMLSKVGYLLREALEGRWIVIKVSGECEEILRFVPYLVREVREDICYMRGTSSDWRFL